MLFLTPESRRSLQKICNHLEPNPNNLAKKFLFCLRGAGSDAFKGAGATSGAGDITADGL